MKRALPIFCLSDTDKRGVEHYSVSGEMKLYPCQVLHVDILSVIDSAQGETAGLKKLLPERLKVRKVRKVVLCDKGHNRADFILYCTGHLTAVGPESALRVYLA